jgi:CcmD family protein
MQRLRLVLAPLLLVAALLAAAPAARAAEATMPATGAAAPEGFVQVEGRVAERIPAGPFLAGAYGFIWVAVLAYVVSVARGLGRVRGEIDELRRRVDRGTP